MHDCPKCHDRPGSDTARAKGCNCAVLDNAHGHSDPRWTCVRLDCPVHGAEYLTEAGGSGE